MARSTRTKTASRLPRPMVLGGIALAVLLVAAAAYAWNAQRNAANLQPSPTPTRGNSTHDEPTPSPTPVSTSNGTPTTRTPAPTQAPAPVVAVTKPTLQKSSGNAPGSSVPSGSMIEFSCEGSQGATCEIILTDKADANRQLKLDAKVITSNGRGQSFATWNWSAVRGSWSVIARSSNSAGTTASSDAQTLEVK